MKVIAIDYDNTITLNPAAFKRHVSALAQELGVECIVATARRGTISDVTAMTDAGVYDWCREVVWCGPCRFKIDACRAKGYEVVMWMDDQPEADKRGGPIVASLLGVWKWLCG